MERKSFRDCYYIEFELIEKNWVEPSLIRRNKNEMIMRLRTKWINRNEKNLFY